MTSRVIDMFRVEKNLAEHNQKLIDITKAGGF